MQTLCSLTPAEEAQLLSERVESAVGDVEAFIRSRKTDFAAALSLADHFSQLLESNEPFSFTAPGEAFKLAWECFYPIVTLDDVLRVRFTQVIDQLRALSNFDVSRIDACLLRYILVRFAEIALERSR